MNAAASRFDSLRLVSLLLGSLLLVACPPPDDDDDGPVAPPDDDDAPACVADTDCAFSSGTWTRLGVLRAPGAALGVVSGR